MWLDGKYLLVTSMAEKKADKELTKIRRVTIIVSEEEKELLEKLKKKTGKTVTNILKDGMDLYWKRYIKEQELLKQLDDDWLMLVQMYEKGGNYVK